MSNEFEKRIAAKQEREALEKKKNGKDPNAPYKLPCGCETYVGEESAFTNLQVPFPFVKLDGGASPTLILQFCKKCKGAHKSWWEIPKPNISKIFKPPGL